MKKTAGFLILVTVLFLLTGAALAENIPVDAVHFPDENFRAYVAENIDRNGDGVLSEDERRVKEVIYVHEKNIASLEGIACFSALQYLYCYENQLTSLDVSHNPALQELWCYGNQLTSLDVSHNPALQALWCFGNQLTSLDVSHNPDLQYLSFFYNQLTSLDVSHNPDLQYLYCYGNQLTSLDVSHNPALKQLWCYDNQLTSLDVSHNPALTRLDCENNQLTSLDVSHNPALQTLYCFDNQLDITTHNGQFDLSALPGFDVTKASWWDGGTVSGTILTATSSDQVTYTYDCGSGYYETFTLNIIEGAGCELDPLLSYVANGSKFYDGKSCEEQIMDYMKIVCENIDDHGETGSWGSRKYLVKDRDYIVSYLNEWTGRENDLISAGSIKVTVTGINGHSGTLTGYYTIQPKALSQSWITLNASAVPKRPQVTVQAALANGVVLLQEGRDYTVTYTDQSSDTVRVVVSGIGNYTSDITLIYQYDPNLYDPNDIAILPEVFPDENLRAYVADQFDWNGDGVLSEDERNAVETISVTGENIASIASLEGIACFSALQTLYCFDNQLTSLDVSHNPDLQYLYCYGNQLTSLDVSHNPDLEELDCGGNQLTSLDVSHNPDLTWLDCSNNQLTSLDVSHNPDLQELYCYDHRLDITAQNGQFDLSALPGFDVTKASWWDGGTVSGTILTVTSSGQVTYTYDCGRGYERTFTLNVRLISGDTMLILPAGLKTIRERAFAGVAAEVVIVPDGCVSIAAGAFANCPNLIEIIVPAGCAVADGACDASVVITRR